MDDRLTSQQKEAILEDALRTYPVRPLHINLTSAVMARIRSAPAPRFQLQWNDFILSLILALCIGAVWLGIQSLPPIVMARLQVQSILFWQRVIVNAQLVLPLGISVIGIVLAFASLRMLRSNS
jgi:NO-binding membrane sensor protein with MHYT domain